MKIKDANYPSEPIQKPKMHIITIKTMKINHNATKTIIINQKYCFDEIHMLYVTHLCNKNGQCNQSMN